MSGLEGVGYFVALIVFAFILDSVLRGLE